MARTARLTRAGLALFALGLWACGSGAGGQQPTSSTTAPPARYGPAEALFSFADAQIVESSGFAASGRADGVYYTHNDSGDAARFFVVDGRGCTLVRQTVAGASATDWEDMARGPGPSGAPSLWLGDIGDNGAARPFVTVYAVPEPAPPPRGSGSCPAPASARVAGARFDLVYPNGPHDAEGLFVHPRTGRLYIVTKGFGIAGETGVFEAPFPLVAGAKNRMTEVATLNVDVVTGAAISPDGGSVVVRTYTTAYEWRGVKNDVGAAMRRAPLEISLPVQPQGEAIAYTRDGKGLLISSEEPAPLDPPVFLMRRAS